MLVAASRRRVVAAIVGCLVAGAGASPREADADRRGKVVRVERPRRTSGNRLRACLLTGPADRFTCFGSDAPKVDDEYTVIGTDGIRGQVRVSKVTAGEYDTCKLGVAHDAEYEYLVAPKAPAPPPSGYWGVSAVAVRGLELGGAEPRMIEDHGQISVPDAATGTVWLAVDLSGDGFADMISAWHEGCDVPENRPNPPPNRTIKPLCLDYWVKVERRWTLKRTDSYYLCM